MSKNYISGFEETVSRFLALIATVAFFSIYILSKDIAKVNLDWNGLTTHLVVFWFVYEFVGYILFIILSQFSKNKKVETVIKDPTLTDNNFKL
jgi:hypothetical protein